MVHFFFVTHVTVGNTRNRRNNNIYISWAAIPSTTRGPVSVQILPAPSNISISNIAATSASLNWDNVPTAAFYEWKVVLHSAGINSSGVAGSTVNPPNTTNIISSLTANTSYDIFLRSACTGGGFSDWSAVTTFTTLPPCTTPTAFNITGGGNYCSGTSGLSIGLSSSQTGINYELYLDGITTSIIKAGTAISFDNISNDGIYTIIASDALTGNCTQTMTGSANVLTVFPDNPAISIALTIGTFPIQEGTSVTFTATPTNGGSNPIYQWKVNGNNAGTNSEFFTSSALQDADVVSCEMTSSATCLLTPTATSNSITMQVIPTRWYVNASASGTNTGTSWANAFTSLQAAIDAANVGYDIWVAQGIYKPTKDASGNPNPSDPRAKTFYLKNDIKIYGGFIGNESQLSQRNPTANPTILNGDINGDDVVSGTGETLVLSNTTENVYHVVLSIDDNTTTVLDGFTISGGAADDMGVTDDLIDNRYIGRGYGGGIFMSHSSPTLQTLTFINNLAVIGGGAFVDTLSAPIITNNSFLDNYTIYYGGGLANNSANPTITKCLFKGNATDIGGLAGGILSLNNTNATINNCVISNNFSSSGGGAFSSSSNDTYNNCIFYQNTANYDGGGIYCQTTTNSFNNCVFVLNNTIGEGGGLFTGGSMLNLTNCIVWGNVSASSLVNSSGIYDDNTGGVISIGYSTIQSNTIPNGTNNQNVNPLFVNLADGDGTDNQWWTNDDGLRLGCGSPAYGAGTDIGVPANDILNQPVYASKDIGAYEKQSGNAFSTVSLSQSGGTTSGSGINTITTACTGTPITLTANIVGPVAASYQWQRNGVDLAGQTNQTLVLTSGWGVYKVKIININSCFANTDTFSISFKGLPNAQAGTDRNICANTPTNLGAPTVASYTYSWYPPAGLSGTNISNPVATINTTSTYTVTVTSTNGCVKSDAVTLTTLTQPDAPILTTTAPIDVVQSVSPTVCEGVVISLTPSNVNNATQIQWIRNGTAFSSTTNITGALSINNTAGVANIYTAKVKGQNGCWSQNSNAINATVLTAPIPTITSSVGTDVNNIIKLCPGITSATLSASTSAGTPTYQWFNTSNTNNVLSSTNNLVVSGITTANTFRYVKASYTFSNKVCVRQSATKTIRQDASATGCRLSSTEQELSEAINIVPNPSTDEIQLFLQGFETSEAILSCVNTLGQVMWRKPIQIENAYQAENIDIRNLAAGVYYLSIENEKTHHTVKLIKE